MSHTRRLAIIERLTAALHCSGACPRCCAGTANRPGHLSTGEQAEALFDLLERAGLVFVADAVNALKPDPGYSDDHETTWRPDA